MPINATCPHCKQSFMVPDSAAGKRFKCRNCSQPMDVPAAGAAPASAAVAVADDDDEDTGIDVDEDEEADEAEAAEAEDEDDDEGDDDEGETKAEEKAEEPAGEKKLSARERLKLKREGKTAEAEGAGEKKEEKKSKAFAMPSMPAGPAPDPSAIMGGALGSLQRALHPSRVVTAAVGMATVLLIAAVITALGSLIPVQIVQLLLMLVSGLVVGVGFVVVAVSVAKVDLAGLRGEEVPGPIKALLSSIGGGIGSIISVILLILLIVGVFLAEGIVNLLTLIPYVGSIIGGALIVVFFFVNLAVLLGAPLVMWLTIPLAARSGANPIAPLTGAIARIRREPARILISYIMFIVMTQLVLGVVIVICAAAAMGSGGLVYTERLQIWPGVLIDMPGAFFFDALFVGAGAAIVGGLVMSLPLSAYICSGCQEVHDHPDPS